MAKLPKFYHNSKYGIVCDPSIDAKPKEYKDMPFFDFASDYESQERLGFITTAFIEPSHWWDKPKEIQELREAVAVYISAFKLEKDQEIVYDYLMTNPMIRIIFNN